MTHEYTIAVGGRIGPLGLGRTEVRDTAIAWAADSVLAVGSDDAVRSISRGDSTFLDLGGCFVTALPADLDRAKSLIQDGPLDEADIGSRFVRAGLVDPDSLLGPGSRADLAFWAVDPATSGPGPLRRFRLVAVVRDGAFIDGDEHRGPFRSPRQGP